MKAKCFIAVFVMLLFVATLGVASGSKEGAAPAEKPDKLVLMNAGSLSGDPGIDYIRQQWAEETGVEVEVIEQAETHLFDKELAALSSGDPGIDIMAANDRWVRDWAAAGWLEPLDDIMADIAEHYTQGADSGLIYDGSYYGAHGGNMVMMMYYRTDLLEEYGMSEPPRTWSELVEFGKWATQDTDGDGTTDQWGVVHAGQPVTHFGDVVYTLAHQLGGTIYDDNEINVDSPELRTALQAVVDLRQVHGISPRGVNTYGSNEVLQALQSGTAATAFSWTWMGKLLNAEDSAVKDNWSWTIMPVLPNGNRSSISITTPLVLNRASEHKSYAKDLIETYASYEGQVTEVVREFGNVALMPGVYEEPLVTDPPDYALDAVNLSKDQWVELQSRILEAVEKVRVEYAQKQGELDRALWPEMNAALSGIKSVEQALQDAQVQLERINETVQ